MVDERDIEETGVRTLTQDESDLLNELMMLGESLGRVGKRVAKHRMFYVNDPDWHAIGLAHLKQGLMAWERAVTKQERF